MGNLCNNYTRERKWKLFRLESSGKWYLYCDCSKPFEFDSWADGMAALEICFHLKDIDDDY